MTALILSHQSARTYWSSPWIKHAEKPLSSQEAHDALISTQESLHRQLLTAVRAHEPFEQLPAVLDLLVASRDDRRSTKQAKLRCIQTELPAGALLRVGQIELPENEDTVDVLVSSPAFTLVQMAAQLDALELVEFGFELCGNYALDDRAAKGFVQCPAVATPTQLQAFAQEAAGVTGAKPARRACRFVLPNAKSPDEAVVAMFAHLPRSLGGIGVPAPLLDQAIPLPEDITRMVGTRALTPTLFWPEIDTALEYDPREESDSLARRDYLSRKRDAYERVGCTLIELSRTDLDDLDSIRRTLEGVAHRLGKRTQPANERQMARQQETLERLLAWASRKAAH